MARSYDEVQYRPQEAPKAAEYSKTSEAEPVTAECTVPEEDRTFPTENRLYEPETNAKASKTKTVTTAAAIFAAAGLTLFSAFSVTTELLRMPSPTEPTVQTEETQTEETAATDETPNF